MTYPIPNYSRIWVRGKFIDLSKAAKEEAFYGIGQPVVFTPSPKVLLDQGTGQIISTGPFKVDTSKTDGYFQILLPATNDPDIIPFDFTYRVMEPSGRAAYDIKVPIDTPYLNEPSSPLHGERVVDLISIVPAPSPSSGTVQLLSGRGIWDVWIDEANHLRGEYDTGATFDAGVVSVGSVNGQQGTVVLTKSDVGLANVTNTSDASKPVSSAQASAITSAQTAAQTFATNADTAHTSASDPHSQYYNQFRGDARYRKTSDYVTVPAYGSSTIAGRFVGIKTTTGVPTNSGFAHTGGDLMYNQVDRKWMLCTSAGSPGTWTIQP